MIYIKISDLSGIKKILKWKKTDYASYSSGENILLKINIFKFI